VEHPEEVSGTTLVDLLRDAAQVTYLGGDAERAVALGERALELIPDSDRVTAALARDRLGRYLWTSGRHSEAAAAYSRAVEQMPAEPASAARARVLASLASLAQVLMLRGDLLDSRELATEAIEIARAAGDRAVEAHALNTLGVDIASLGRREEGIAKLRAALAIELELGPSDNLQRSYTNLSDALDQDGRVEEGVELALEGTRAALDQGMARGWAAFLLAEVANRCTRLGRLAEAQRLIDEALDYGATGVQGGLVNEVATRVAMMTGRFDDATTYLPEAGQLLRRANGSMWLAPMYARMVELADRDRDIDNLRRVAVEAREVVADDEEYAFYSRELYLAVLRAEADAAARARAARDGRRGAGGSPPGARGGHADARARGRRRRGGHSPAAGACGPRSRGGGGGPARRAPETRAVAHRGRTQRADRQPAGGGLRSHARSRGAGRERRRPRGGGHSPQGSARRRG